MSPDPDIASLIATAVRDWLRNQPEGKGLMVVGLCGAQGSGKSTLAARLEAMFEAEGIGTAVLSLDDLYKTRSEREELARDVHPLLRTRGVPGTHDVALGLGVIAALERRQAIPLPRFDKSIDDRAPDRTWPLAPAGTSLLFLEGWCVGAVPQSIEQLAVPCNALEREADASGAWRRYVNAALTNSYQTLYGRLDHLVLLAAPGFDVVVRWRQQQEHDLIRRTGRGMTDAEVVAFAQHYERLTRHILAEMPSRADHVVSLDADRHIAPTLL